MPVVEETLDTSIPGLDSSLEELERLKPKPQRKVPYARPVPQTFQEEWEANKVRKFLHFHVIFHSVVPYFGKKEASDIPWKSELLMFSYFT